MPLSHWFDIIATNFCKITSSSWGKITDQWARSASTCHKLEAYPFLNPRIYPYLWRSSHHYAAARTLLSRPVKDRHPRALVACCLLQESLMVYFWCPDASNWFSSPLIHFLVVMPPLVFFDHYTAFRSMHLPAGIRYIYTVHQMSDFSPWDSWDFLGWRNSLLLLFWDGYTSHCGDLRVST